ncbi:MAG: ABC transporter ATP-binding protein [Syntrophorhabdales bacterium]|jgi:branched-chain amino acid transport system ATP-binding protein
MLLEIRELTVHYGSARALNRVSIAVDEGEIVALVGANGAGKTTTLRSVSGLLSPTSGEILFQGRSTKGLAVHDIVRLGIAHVPEGRGTLSPMTVFENLRMGAYLQKDKRRIARDLEAMYDHFPVLSKRRGQLAGNLSGGEQQMLAIARALMARPKLLLMDEPSMGLSPLMVEEVAGIVRDINERGMSIVLVEQNARMALDLCHRAYILEVGEVVLQGYGRDLAKDEAVNKAYLGG